MLALYIHMLKKKDPEARRRFMPGLAWGGTPPDGAARPAVALGATTRFRACVLTPFDSQTFAGVEEFNPAQYQVSAFGVMGSIENNDDLKDKLAKQRTVESLVERCGVLGLTEDEARELKWDKLGKVPGERTAASSSANGGSSSRGRGRGRGGGRRRGRGRGRGAARGRGRGQDPAPPAIADDVDDFNSGEDESDESYSVMSDAEASSADSEDLTTLTQASQSSNFDFVQGESSYGRKRKASTKVTGD